jgi:hypothetical protein
VLPGVTAGLQHVSARSQRHARRLQHVKASAHHGARDYSMSLWSLRARVHKYRITYVSYNPAMARRGRSMSCRSRVGGTSRITVRHRSRSCRVATAGLQYTGGILRCQAAQQDYSMSSRSRCVGGSRITVCYRSRCWLLAQCRIKWSRHEIHKTRGADRASTDTGENSAQQNRKTYNSTKQSKISCTHSCVFEDACAYLGLQPSVLASYCADHFEHHLPHHESTLLPFITFSPLHLHTLLHSLTPPHSSTHLHTSTPPHSSTLSTPPHLYTSPIVAV